MDNETHAGLGISGVALAWGLITQCLQWAGVISWHWLAIWGPFLLILLFCLLFFIVGVAAFLIADALDDWRRKH